MAALFSEQKARTYRSHVKAVSSKHWPRLLAMLAQEYGYFACKPSDHNRLQQRHGLESLCHAERRNTFADDLNANANSISDDGVLG
jgi:hypothetical protein